MDGSLNGCLKTIIRKKRSHQKIPRNIEYLYRRKFMKFDRISRERERERPVDVECRKVFGRSAGGRCYTYPRGSGACRPNWFPTTTRTCHASSAAMLHTRTRASFRVSEHEGRFRFKFPLENTKRRRRRRQFSRGRDFFFPFNRSSYLGSDILFLVQNEFLKAWTFSFASRTTNRGNE